MHGLLFGGFTAANEEEEYSVISHDSNVSNDIVARPGGHFQSSGSDPYRSFGNHRIATHLRKNGWDIECLDWGLRFSDEELYEFVDKRITKKTIFVGFSLIFYTKANSRMNRLVRYIRDEYPWVTIISGGVKIYTVTRVDADWFIAGNGEYAMDALLKHLVGNGPEPTHREIFGRKLIETQHTYPCFPKRDAAIKYEERDFVQANEVLNVEFGRGCIFNCKYCNFPLLGMKGDTTRNPDSIYEELLDNYERWGITTYYITDDTVNDSKNKLKIIADAVRRLPFRPHFVGWTRADLLIRHGKDTWDDMIDTGYTSHAYGIETFNYESGKSVGKGMKPEELKDGLLEVQDYFTEKSEHHYSGNFTMIAGLPFETYETLDEGKEWVNKYWDRHAVTYFPLMLGAPFDLHDQMDDMDTKVVDNFKSYGYVDNFERPFVSEPHLNGVIDMLTGDANSGWNYWTHPSGDYDFVDMMEWVYEFTQERFQLNMNSAGVWQINYVHAKTCWDKTDKMSDYYKKDAKSLPYTELINIIRQYKRNKLS